MLVNFSHKFTTFALCCPNIIAIVSPILLALSNYSHCKWPEITIMPYCNSSGVATLLHRAKISIRISTLFFENYLTVSTTELWDRGNSPPYTHGNSLFENSSKPILGSLVTSSLRPQNQHGLLLRLTSGETCTVQYNILQSITQSSPLLHQRLTKSSLQVKC